MKITDMEEQKILLRMEMTMEEYKKIAKHALNVAMSTPDYMVMIIMEYIEKNNNE